jgi:hypothetical protein
MDEKEVCSIFITKLNLKLFSAATLQCADRVKGIAWIFDVT